MSIMDAKGHSRPGMFETIVDENTGVKFTPMSGQSKYMVFKAEGPGVKGDGVFEAKAKADPLYLRMAAAEQGVMSMPSMSILMPFPMKR